MTKKFTHWITAPKTQVVFNGVMWVFWLIMVPITLIVAPLRTAILYVALMSVWANFATHLGGWIASLVNARAENLEAKSEEAVTLQHIEQLLTAVLVEKELQEDA